MTQDNSTLVRIGRDTKFKLEQLAALWIKLYASGRMDVPHPNDKDVISIDRVIRELLKRDEEHRGRSRKNSPARPDATPLEQWAGLDDGRADA